MLAQAVKPLVRLVDRYLPDPYIFVLILTLIVMAAAMAVEGHGPVAVIGMWGDGFWDLLAFCVIGTGSTTFAFFNLAIIAALLVVVPLINRLMLPSEADSIYVDRALLLDAAPEDGKIERPADRLETSRLVSSLVGLAGGVWLVGYFSRGGGLTLNTVNFLFLTLAILLHGMPRRLLASLQEVIKGGGGIVIQFPFYAGIMGIMVGSGLADTMSKVLLSGASERTLPFLVFISAGIVNFFVPSGGGQWAVQAPAILPAAHALGADMARVAMAVAWGDAWTSLIQPFWVLPVLAIAGLQAKDIMGYCAVHLLLTGIIIAIGLTFL